jgi:hypothetical protein
MIGHILSILCKIAILTNILVHRTLGLVVGELFARKHLLAIRAHNPAFWTFFEVGSDIASARVKTALIRAGDEDFVALCKVVKLKLKARAFPVATIPVSVTLDLVLVSGV